MTVPLSLYVATYVGKRSQPHFVQQWRSTGTLNAHIEEMYTGHTLVKVFGGRTSRRSSSPSRTRRCTRPGSGPS
ncbi:hypothetical protein SVIOM74S_02203 [Streptomyces violarus]